MAPIPAPKTVTQREGHIHCRYDAPSMQPLDVTFDGRFCFISDEGVRLSQASFLSPSRSPPPGWGSLFISPGMSFIEESSTPAYTLGYATRNNRAPETPYP